MNNDDSFNDSDEIISLYSSKKVKETFKTQLQKIVSSSNSINTNKEVTTGLKPATNDKTGNNTIRSSESLILSTRNSTSTQPLKVLDGLTEVLPKRKTRQSKSRRNKRGESISEVTIISDSPPKKHSTRSSKRVKKNRKQNGIPVEVIVLDDSVESEKAEEEEEEDLNPEVSVKVIWKSVSVRKYQIRRFQKFSKIFELLSQEEDIPEDKIMLTFNNIKVRRNDTPDSLNLQVYDFLDGGVLSELSNSYDSKTSLVDNSDKVNLKFRDSKKNVVKVRMDRKDKMKVGMIQCSEQLEIPFEKIKFYFDGELIEPLQTPESLDLDNDEIIDIKICD